MGIKSLHVAILTGTYGRGLGSGGQAEALARGLRARGHVVSVFCRRNTSGEATMSLPRARRDLASVAQRVRESLPEVDLIHAFERVPGADVYRAGGGVHRAWLSVAPSAWTRCRWRPSVRSECSLDRDSASSAAWVVANSARAAGELVAWHGVARERVCIIRNGVDVDRFRPSPSRRLAFRAQHGVSGRVTLFLGHDGGGRKGLDQAIEAFFAVRQPGDVLAVAGRVRLGRWPRGVVALGTVSPEDVLPCADAVLAPSRYDASSNVVLEAMACEIPVVVSKRDGASEVVPDHRVIVSNPEDTAGVADALRYAWRLGPGAGWREAAAAWPENRMVDDTCVVYRRVVNGS